MAEREKDELTGMPNPDLSIATVRRVGYKSADRIAGIVLGCAIGDALGMAVEGGEADETSRAIRRLGGIRDFLAPQPHVLRTLRKLRPGCWTDDTQLTVAIARSIIQRGGLEYDAVAQAHVDAFESLELRGWETITKQACRRLAQGTHRLRSGTLGGDSNGVAMKIAPIAAWSHVMGESRDRLLQHCLNVGIMTHYDPRAIVGAYLVALLVRDALAAPRRWEPAPERYDELIEEARWAESMIALRIGVSDDPISQHLEELSDALDSDSIELAELAHGASAHVCSSIPFVVALLCGRPWEFEEGVLAAVNAGGDTDTNTAIVGAILGATCGIRKLPRRFVDKLEEIEMLRDVANAFGASLCR